MSVTAFKEAIMMEFPDSKNQLLYIYNHFGLVLFKNEWNDLKLWDTSTEEFWPQVTGILTIIKMLSKEEQAIIVNYIFQQSIEYLIKLDQTTKSSGSSCTASPTT